MSYQLGDKTWRTKEEVNDAAMAAIYRNVGGRIQGEDFVLIDDLFRLHPEWESKSGGEGYELHSLPNRFGTVSGWVVRSDGTADDFSIGKCIRAMTHS